MLVAAVHAWRSISVKSDQIINGTIITQSVMFQRRQYWDSSVPSTQYGGTSALRGQLMPAVRAISM